MGAVLPIWSVLVHTICQHAPKPSSAFISMIPLSIITSVTSLGSGRFTFISMTPFRIITVRQK